MKTKGVVLREARQEMELTQTGLAEELGVRKNTVYRWESGLLAIPRTVELAIDTLLAKHRKKREKTNGSKKAQDDVSTEMGESREMIALAPAHTSIKPRPRAKVGKPTKKPAKKGGAAK